MTNFTVVVQPKPGVFASVAECVFKDDAEQILTGYPSGFVMNDGQMVVQKNVAFNKE